MHRRTFPPLQAVLLLTVPLVLASAAGCDSGPPPGRGKLSASVVATAAPPASATAQPNRGKPPARSASSATAEAVATGDPATVTLADGATLRMPTGAIASTVPKSLPPEVTRAHKFQLGGPKQLLLVSQMDLAGTTCVARLELEWEKLERSKADADPEKLKVRRVAKVEDLKVEGQRVLFSEAVQTARGGPDDSELAAPIVTAMMCRAKNMLVLMYAGTTKRPASEVRTLLLDVVKSYKPKKG